MQCPFPGMDPYLEAPAHFPDLHQSFITYLREELQPLLAPRFHARIGERIYVLEPSRIIYPDITIIERQPEPALLSSNPQPQHDTPIVLIAPEAEVREPFIEIHDLEQNRVVTVIEMLSPANKTRGARGRGMYLKKQRQVLHSDANLVEIDLLRGGEHTICLPIGMVHLLPRHHYKVCVNRASHRNRFEVYAFTVRERFPRVSIPLAGDANDVVVDLGIVFKRCYERGRYGAMVDYSVDPPPPSLEEDDLKWLREQLVKAGLRK